MRKTVLIKLKFCISHLPLGTKYNQRNHILSYKFNKNTFDLKSYSRLNHFPLIVSLAQNPIIEHSICTYMFFKSLTLNLLFYVCFHLKIFGWPFDNIKPDDKMYETKTKRAFLSKVKYRQFLQTPAGTLLGSCQYWLSCYSSAFTFHFLE